MSVTIRHIIRSICLVVGLVVLPIHIIGQEQTVQFTWKDTAKKLCSADLSMQLVHEPTRGLFKLTLSVRWYTSDGIRIQANSPYLYLSKYYLTLLPNEDFECITFNGANKTDLLFQNQDDLFLTCHKIGNTTLTISAQFRYALSFTDYQDGRMAEIGLDGKKMVELRFPVTQPAEEKVVTSSDSGNAQNPDDKDQTNSYSQNLLNEVQRFEYRQQGFIERNQTEGLQNLVQSLDQKEEFSDLPNLEKDSLQRLTNEGLRKGEMTRRDLDEFIGEMESFKAGIQKKNMPSGIYPEVSARVNKVLEDLRMIRNSYSKALYDLTGYRQQLLSTNEIGVTDSLIEVVKEIYLPIMGKQLDSLDILNNMFDHVSGELQPFLEGPRGKSIGNRHLDSLRGLHTRIGQLENQLRNNHTENWINYRNQIVGLQTTVPEIENLHAEFTREDFILKSAIQSKDTEIQSLDNRISSPGFLSSRWVLWIGSGIIVIFLVFWLIWAIRRTDRKSALTPGLASVGYDPANSGMVSGYLVDSKGVLDPVAYEEYYQVVCDLQNPDITITSLYLHFSVIKSIYQLIQGALLRKDPTDFGGFLFGSYYRVTESKTHKYEVLIDKFVASGSIRTGENQSLDTGEDMVDELDSAVKQNKKYLLMGWFASSQDATMIMPDELVKIHRNFFKEKWQISLLIFPGSEDLRSVLFLRRKSGFFDPIPDPSAMIRWDELYQYAVNPPRLKRLQAAQMRMSVESYLLVKMTSSWSDSLVNHVHFNPEILNVIRTAVDHQDLLNPGFKVSGFLYGSFEPNVPSNNSTYDLFVERFIEAQNGNKARELPGFRLLGWWGSGREDIFNLLGDAVPYHEQFFKEAFHIACLENAISGEFRILSRKQNMELNNHVIETEEFNLHDLIASIRK